MPSEGTRHFSDPSYACGMEMNGRVKDGSFAKCPRGPLLATQGGTSTARTWSMYLPKSKIDSFLFTAACPNTPQRGVVQRGVGPVARRIRLLRSYHFFRPLHTRIR
jgi:hypothetical protein